MGVSMSSFAAWIRVAGVAVAYGVALVLYLRAAPSGWVSPWFVLVAMVCFLGLAFVAEPVVPIRVPAALRKIRGREAEGRFHRALGVPAFGWLLRRTPLKLLNAQVYWGRCGRDPEALVAKLEAAEASHLWAGILVGPYMVYALVQGAWGTVFWLSVAQLLANAYPIAHLRLARHRVERIAGRTSARRRLAGESGGGG
jgi:hypothetical protein